MLKEMIEVQNLSKNVKCPFVLEANSLRSLCDPFGPRVEKWLLENYDKSTLFVASDVEYFGPCQISVFVRRERPGS